VEEGARSHEGAHEGRCSGSNLGDLHGPDYGIPEVKRMPPTRRMRRAVAAESTVRPESGL